MAVLQCDIEQKRMSPSTLNKAQSGNLILFSLQLNLVGFSKFSLKDKFQEVLSFSAPLPTRNMPREMF